MADYDLRRGLIQLDAEAERRMSLHIILRCVRETGDLISATTAVSGKATFHPPDLSHPRILQNERRNDMRWNRAAAGALISTGAARSATLIIHIVRRSLRQQFSERIIF